MQKTCHVMWKICSREASVVARRLRSVLVMTPLFLESFSSRFRSAGEQAEPSSTLRDFASEVVKGIGRRDILL